MLVEYLTREWNAPKGAVRHVTEAEYKVLARMGKVRPYVAPKPKAKRKKGKAADVAVSEENKTTE